MSVRYSRDFRARQPGGRRTLTQLALAILARYGSAANLYLPGEGAIRGIQAGNWLDSAGTTSATVDNPTGLAVSAGKKVGPELVYDPDFNDASKWTFVQPTTGSVSVSGGKLYISTQDTFCQAAVFPFVAGVVGSSVQCEIEVESVTGGGISIGYGGAFSPAITSTGTYRIVLTAINTSALVIRRFSGVVAAVVLSFSAKTLPGSHLTQSTTANKPILRLSGGAYAWDFVSSDSFSSTMTPGNAGFICSGVNVTETSVIRTIVGAGAGSDASSGIWLARSPGGLLSLRVGNGTIRETIEATCPGAGVAYVASAGWNTSTMFVGVGNTETSGNKSVNCTSANTINIGVLTGETNPMLGAIGATIIMSVLPTAAERSTLRQFISALSGVAL